MRPVAHRSGGGSTDSDSGSDSGAAAGASALCVDGTYSYSQHHRGTCSHHGGVAQWLQNLPS
ncbi:DUF3761 domain-containing protein [Streptomyces poonensis]|uniref:DUF3761 domain-containing protein n=1 Tax=Streptomyces poonensis TaxID=68255 RepID=UPI001E3A11DE|nr:DUF3761 domain-containing protein [Streptomyces poonensis]